MRHRDAETFDRKTPDEPDDGDSRGWPTLEELERHYMVRVLWATGGRIAGPGGAAEILDMNPSTLRSRLKKLGILE